MRHAREKMEEERGKQRLYEAHLSLGEIYVSSADNAAAVD